MARPSGPKTRCSGKWTESKFTSFIKNTLRSATRKWAPIQEKKKEARVSRGFYLCAGCDQEVPASIKVNGRRKNNVHVDHINPVINPEIGWVSWDDVVERMFCEKDGLQVLCTECHDTKTQKERELATKRRQQEKDE